MSGTWRTDRKPATELGLLVHIMVDDIEASVKEIIDNGGKIAQAIGMEAPEITARFLTQQEILLVYFNSNIMI